MRAGLRIGLVGPLPPPAGGMANQTQQLAALLSAEGCKVELIRTNADYRPTWIGRIPILRALSRLAPYKFSLWRTAGRVDLFHVMANSGWSWHLFAVPAILIARFRGVPVVVNYRGGEAEVFLRRESKWVLPILRRADALAVPSGFLRDVFGRFGVQARIVPNIVDLSRFGAKGTYTGNGAPHLVVTRNLEALYDCATALRAFAIVRRRFPRARLTIAGRGPEREMLLGLAGQLGVGEATSFPGSLDRDAMASLYASADLMLNPSRVDNMPNSVLEALASGVAVVSTNVGGVPYMVNDGRTALLVPPGDPQAMADAALRILSEPSLASALVAAGREMAQRYTWPEVRTQLAALYEEVLRVSAATRSPV